MKRRSSIACCLICFSLCAVLPALGAEATNRSRSVLEDVKELDKPVTYTEARIPLGELVQKVARDTDVKLTAANEVADEPVAVVVKDVSARELLEQLADLLWLRRVCG